MMLWRKQQERATNTNPARFTAVLDVGGRPVYVCRTCGTLILGNTAVHDARCSEERLPDSGGRG